MGQTLDRSLVQLKLLLENAFGALGLRQLFNLQRQPSMAMPDVCLKAKGLGCDVQVLPYSNLSFFLCGCGVLHPDILMAPMVLHAFVSAGRLAVYRQAGKSLLLWCHLWQYKQNYLAQSLNDGRAMGGAHVLGQAVKRHAEEGLQSAGSLLSNEVDLLAA